MHLSEIFTSPLSLHEASEIIWSVVTNSCSDILMGLNIVLTQTAPVLECSLLLSRVLITLWSFNFWYILRFSITQQLIELAHEGLHCADIAWLRFSHTLCFRLFG